MVSGYVNLLYLSLQLLSRSWQMPRRAERVNGQHPLDRSSVPAPASLPRLRLLKERVAQAHLDAAHLAGAAAVGGEPGGAAGDAAAGSGPPGGAPQAAGDGGGVVEAPSASGEQMKEETRGGVFHWEREDGGELARFRAEIREAFGGRGDSAGSDAARVRGGGGGHQPRGVVHPALHAPLSELAVRGGTAVAVVRVARSGLGRGGIHGTRRSEEERWAIDVWPRACQREKALPVRQDTMRAGRPRSQERS